MAAVKPGPLVVSCELDATGRTVLAEALGGAAEIVLLGKVDEGDRAPILANAAVLIAYNTGRELRAGEPPLLRGARLIQFLSAGVDFIPLSALPPEVPVACNAGAYAGPMAEHVLALTLAAAKRLLIEHAHLARGEFNQNRLNRMLAGGVCGILGFGGIGTATARLMRGLGLRIHAINRRGTSATEPLEWIGTPDRLPDLLAVSDVLVISAPLTRATRGLIGAHALSLMKDEAILVNVARGEIVDEVALYEHLRTHPRFTACLDAWWTEPVRHGRFGMGRPFLQLPNVIGSPHNAASVAGFREMGLRRAAENCRRALAGEMPLHLIGADERML